MADRLANDRPRDISVSKLLLDEYNARLGEPQPDQKSTEHALATLLGSQLLEMARDVLTYGTDPSASLIVTPEGAPLGKYRVLEGNRRLLVVKALTRPRIVADVLSPARRKRLMDLSTRFRENPIRRLRCIVYEAEEEAEHWIELRHTGANNGIGLVEWDANDKDRWKSRHGAPTNRKEAGQVLDFVDKVYPPRPEDNKKIFSTLQRIIVDRKVKDRLGIEIKVGLVYSNFPRLEVLKGLAKVVDDLRSGIIKVTDVYHAPDRERYISKFTADELPDTSTRMSEAVLLGQLSSSESTVRSKSSGGGGGFSDPYRDDDGRTAAADSSGSEPPSSSDEKKSEGSSSRDAKEDSGGSPNGGAKKSRVKPLHPRSTTIPNNCFLWIRQPRINVIYRELTEMDVERFTNACAVSLRVFMELSVDHHIGLNNIMTEAARNSAPLAKRMKELAKFLRDNGRIGEQLEKAIVKVADGAGLFSASTTTFNQYVHNEFAYPQPTELRTAWDELQPFMLALWIK
ncbi:hypothetical protein ABZV14_26215 [Streptosporangium canum]|uniref:hypothetical protein n=1 Tax=Streptosporangium canum TaxID=324952 RepID=UPI0033BF5280